MSEQEAQTVAAVAATASTVVGSSATVQFALSFFMNGGL